MVYRETARTRANTAQRRARIERAARFVIADAGFAAASVASVARAADCSTGLIYSYYTNRDELLRTAFADAAGHELAVVTEAVALCSTPAEVVDAVVAVFIRRAVAGRRLAHSLLFEEVPGTVQLERLALRRGYVAAIAGAIERTDISARIGPRAEVFARLLVGGVGENLVDVLDLSQPAPTVAEVEALIATTADFGRSALGVTDHVHLQGDRR